MKKKKITNSDQKRIKTDQPTSLNLPVASMDTDVVEIPEIIDLCTPTISIECESVTIQNTATSNVVSVGWTNLQRRLTVLPLYPTSGSQEETYPLLANIPPHQLNEVELARRRPNAFKASFDIINCDATIPSFLREKYHMFYGSLIEHLKVDMTILDHNYTRLNMYMRKVVDEQIRIFTLRPHEIRLIEEKEYPVALEFFLQFDVNMFYMKTCSFRFARPRTLNEGLFCLSEPEARYELAACGNCGLCYPQYDMTYRLKKTIVEFSQAHKHTFVNGYEAILNCSASCHTRNIIYTLTCPCGQFDYIGETSCSLNDRLIKHREHGNRIIHEFLLGQENSARELTQAKTQGTLRKDRMKLYQHSVRCSAAMQIFLDANPRYWRFIPMALGEAEQSDQKCIKRPTFSDEIDWNIRSSEDCMICLEAVPKPPNGYIFSNRQVVLQAQYFHKKRDRELPNYDIDLYNATIVAVLPEQCSDMFRETIESLFITHAETKLNTKGNVLNDDQQGVYYPLDNPWLIRGDEWCQGLLRRPVPKQN